MNGGLTVSDIFLVHLPVGFDDPKTVANGIRDNGCGKPDESLSLREVRKKSMGAQEDSRIILGSDHAGSEASLTRSYKFQTKGLGGQLGLGDARLTVSYEGSSCSGQCTPPQTAYSVLLDSLSQ